MRITILIILTVFIKLSLVEGLEALKKYPDDNNPEKVAKDAENAVAYIKEMEEKLGK